MLESAATPTRQTPALVTVTAAVCGPVVATLGRLSKVCQKITFISLISGYYVVSFGSADDPGVVEELQAPRPSPTLALSSTARHIHRLPITPVPVETSHVVL
jgi:hypothetical protein